jgi:hypothetical protein
VRQSVKSARPTGARRLPLATVIARVCRQTGIAPGQVATGSRQRAVSRARTGIAFLWVEVLGPPGRPLAGPLGVRPQANYQAVVRARAHRAEWEQVLNA